MELEMDKNEARGKASTLEIEIGWRKPSIRFLDDSVKEFGQDSTPWRNMHYCRAGFLPPSLRDRGDEAVAMTNEDNCVH